MGKGNRRFRGVIERQGRYPSSPRCARILLEGRKALGHQVRRSWRTNPNPKWQVVSARRRLYSPAPKARGRGKLSPR
jgi:hypothetical protein